MEELSTSKVFQQFYAKLVKTLPMDDAIFIAELFSRGLLPDDVKDHIEHLATPAKKASYFLDHVIRPSVTCKVGRSFDDLLCVMKDSEYQSVNELARLIRTSLNKGGKIDGDPSEHISEPAPKKQKSSQIDVCRLKARYHRLLPTSKTDWPKHRVNKYVRLALIKQEDVTLRDENLNELTKLTLQGDVDNILKKKEPLGDLRDIFHYQDRPCPRLILIMGGPGIGKTTLANEICLKWAKDKFLTEDFDAVILIPLRTVQQRSLEEVLIEHVGEENYQQLKNSAGTRCLIILEGFDEMAIDRRKSDPFLMRLIKECTVMEEAVVIITSRPHACEDLDAGRRIEIVGFGKDEIREFVEKSFLNDNQSIEFLQQLDEYPHLHSLCYVPMNLVMIVDIFYCSKNKLPSTLTELYQVFIVMTLQRQVKKKPLCSNPKVTVADSVREALCRILIGIPKEMVEVILLLSRLAYHGLFDWYGDHSENRFMYFGLRKCKDPKIIFTESDLVQCNIQVTPEFDGFGLLKATHTHQLPMDTTTYNFAHLTIQEFLCAVHISLLSQQEQLHLLKENFHEYPNMFTFFCSLTRLASSEIFQFVYSKLIEGGRDVITAARCINESEQLQHHSVQLLSPITLDLTKNTLLPYDCHCISRVLSCYPVSHLMMNGCKIGNKGVKLLVRCYPFQGTGNQPLEELTLLDNQLTIEGMEDVVKLVRKGSSTMLRILNVGKNDIGDNGMALILEGLEGNKSLTELKVEECGLSVKGAVYISQLLNIADTLQVLYISGNDIGDDGMAVISEALQNNVALMIAELWVANCGLSAKGAVTISKVMMVNHSLQKLGIGFNNIGDDGISAIAGALGNCKIRELNAMECSITLAGTKSLAVGLSSNHTIKVLWLQDNPISVEGALLINSAVVNTNCRYVGINNEYKSDKAIAKANLKSRWMQLPEDKNECTKKDNCSKN